jgi:AAA+ ATPase superfamily predicted ATPase
MKYFIIEKNKEFIDRTYEIAKLESIASQKGSRIVIVYGRRRVGKTELLEQVFRKRNIIKFEGRDKITPAQQMQFVMQQLANYAEQPLLAKIAVSSWVDVLTHIADAIHKEPLTLYFEEVQWLANYSDDFISALKYCWDNFFRFNDQLILILCGSSPSFMINKVVKSSALYNRSQHELPIHEFNLSQAKALLSNHSDSEILDAYLTIGGMPEYLKRLLYPHSTFLNLVNESFLPGGFFLHEYERIFTSSLADKKPYKKIIEYLSKYKFATRSELAAHLKIQSGGTMTELLNDLEICGFIERYTPFDKPDNSLLTRYAIADNYLQFYFKFIKPITKKIEQGDFIKAPAHALSMTQYQQWLGYAFERFCKKYHNQIAKILGISGVKYRAGSYFSRQTQEKSPGFQIDLLFDRDDKVITICEIKYSQNRINTRVIDEFAEKIMLFPNAKNKTIQRVLITNQQKDPRLLERAYFDRIIFLEDIFDSYRHDK